MNPALELVWIVEENGGRLRVDGDVLVIFPEAAGMPIFDRLKEYKREIMALLAQREEEGDVALGLWLLDRCVFRDGCSGGVGGLYLDFARWCAEGSRRFEGGRGTFQAALIREGFNVSKGFVYGLLIREDLESALSFEWAPPAAVSVAKRKPKVDFLAGTYEAA